MLPLRDPRVVGHARGDRWRSFLWVSSIFDSV